MRTMKTVTFDSTTKPNNPVVLAAVAGGWGVAFASVSLREAKGTDFEVDLKKHNCVAELAVWGESSWDKARWGDEVSSDQLEKILAIISSGSFPKNRSNLSKGQLHQLRDAMILEAHRADRRTLFVTGDATAFINNNRREQLQVLLTTRILSTSEFEAELRAAGMRGV